MDGGATKQRKVGCINRQEEEDGQDGCVDEWGAMEGRFEMQQWYVYVSCDGASGASCLPAARSAADSSTGHRPESAIVVGADEMPLLPPSDLRTRCIRVTVRVVQRAEALASLCASRSASLWWS